MDDFSKIERDIFNVKAKVTMEDKVPYIEKMFDYLKIKLEEADFASQNDKQILFCCRLQNDYVDFIVQFNKHLQTFVLASPVDSMIGGSVVNSLAMEMDGKFIPYNQEIVASVFHVSQVESVMNKLARYVLDIEGIKIDPPKPKAKTQKLNN